MNLEELDAQQKGAVYWRVRQNQAEQKEKMAANAQAQETLKMLKRLTKGANPVDPFWRRRIEDMNLKADAERLLAGMTRQDLGELVTEHQAYLLANPPAAPEKPVARPSNDRKIARYGNNNDTTRGRYL